MNHVLGVGDDFRAAGEAGQVMAKVAVVAFNGQGVRFAHHMSLRRQHLSEGIPVVSVEEAATQVLDLGVEAPEGLSITAAQHPGHSSP